MPIYAYRCESCGHAKDVLQKMSDEPLTVCPSCSAATFKKQVTAAGFQLKGSGWYATDFKGGATAPAAATDAATPTDKGSGTPAAAPTSGGGDSATTGSSSAATGCGGGCACH